MFSPQREVNSRSRKWLSDIFAKYDWLRRQKPRRGGGSYRIAIGTSRVDASIFVESCIGMIYCGHLSGQEIALLHEYANLIRWDSCHGSV